MMCNNPYLDLININTYTKFGQFYQLVLKLLSRIENLTSIKVHNSAMNLQKMMCNNPNVELANY